MSRLERWAVKHSNNICVANVVGLVRIRRAVISTHYDNYLTGSLGSAPSCTETCPSAGSGLTNQVTTGSGGGGNGATRQFPAML